MNKVRINADDPFGDEPEIIIERREEIGRVRLSYSGTQSPINASLDIIASYLNENLQDNAGMHIEFTIPQGGHTFSLNVTPNPVN